MEFEKQFFTFYEIIYHEQAEQWRNLKNFDSLILQQKLVWLNFYS